MSDNGAAAKVPPLEPTGRELREPAATLVELSDGDNVYTAVRFDEVFHGHPALNVGIDLIRSFLEYPMVIGLAEMSDADTGKGTFVFDTGPIWTLTEVLRRHRDIGQTVGVRAALELAFLAAQILHEAGEIGPREGCYSHGNLTPWRIAMRADGSVQVFGYGLPAIEWICHRDDPDYVIDADSLRYAPPERLDLGAEDPSADSYALMLIVWEMITGQPLMDGHDVDKLKKAISLSEAQQIVSKARIKDLPKEALDLIARCLIYDPDTRLSGKELLDLLRKIITGKLPGDSLADVMVRIRGKAGKTPKGRKIASMQGTAAYTPQQLAALAEEEDDDEDEAEDEKEETRWGKSRRRKKADEAQEEAPEPTGRRRRRSASDDPSEEDESEEPSRRRRRRSTAEEEPQAPDDDAGSDDDASPRRRRRRSEATEDETPAPAAKEATPEPEAEEPSRRRRRRGSDSESEPAPEAKAEPKAEPKPEPKAEPKSEPPKVEAEAAPAESEEAPRRRRRRSEDSDDSPAAAAPVAEEEPAAEDSPRRRRRRSEGSDDAPEAKDEPAAEEPAGDDPAPRRRRRRSE